MTVWIILLGLYASVVICFSFYIFNYFCNKARSYMFDWVLNFSEAVHPAAIFLFFILLFIYLILQNLIEYCCELILAPKDKTKRFFNIWTWSLIYKKSLYHRWRIARLTHLLSWFTKFCLSSISCSIFFAHFNQFLVHWCYMSSN